MFAKIYDVISYYFIIIIYFFYYLLKGNSEEFENDEDVLKRRQEPYYNKFNNVNKDYVSTECYDNNKYFNSQTNHFHSLNNNFDYQKRRQHASFYETVWASIKNLYSNIKYYFFKIYNSSIYVLKCIGSILYTPFLYLFYTIIYIIQTIVTSLLYVINAIWNFFFRKSTKVEGDEIGLRKKTDDISEDIVNGDIEYKQLPDERCKMRNYIKESECSSIANTKVETLKNCNENKYEKYNDESLLNFNKYYEDDNLFTQKHSINLDVDNKFNEIVQNNGNKSIESSNIIEDVMPPTPPPPLDDNILRMLGKKEKIPDSLSPQPTMHEENIHTNSPSFNTTIQRKKEYNDVDMRDWTPTKNIIIIDTNKNEKLDDNNYIFNNLISKTFSSVNPVSPDFFIGNSVFKPVPDMEIYRQEFNRKTKDKWHETIISPIVPNNRNVREGTTFDANIHSDELKNKNYYITSPSERSTPIFNRSNSFSNLKNNFDSNNLPTNYHDIMNQTNYNIGDIKENPTLLSCKRTFERRVISRRFNQDSQGHFNKDWEVQSYQAVKDEMPVSYNFYTRSAYK